MSSIFDTLNEIRDAVDPGIRGPVTVYPSLDSDIGGEYAWVEPDNLDLSNVNPVTISAGTLIVRIAVRVQSIDHQDHARRFSELLDPNSDNSLQRLVWGQCPEAKMVGVVWGSDPQTPDYFGADLRVSVVHQANS